MTYFWVAQKRYNRPPQNTEGCDVTWALLSKNDCFSGADIPIEIDLNQKVLIPMKYLLDLFLCKNER